MGYFTYRIFKGISVDRLHAKVLAYRELFEPGTVGWKITVSFYHGKDCSAMMLGYLNHEEQVLRPIGFHFGSVWMDVRYQDGDSWELTISKGPEHLVTHSVNPWAHDEAYQYNQQQIDYRVKRVCQLWPDQATRIERYLLPWQTSVVEPGRTRLVARTGKAYPDDAHEYGDAMQVEDFVRVFVDTASPVVTLEPHGLDAAFARKRRAGSEPS